MILFLDSNVPFFFKQWGRVQQKESWPNARQAYMGSEVGHAGIVRRSAN